ncbi:MAG: hypothetical protein WCC52_00265, partial [Nitrosotalea sp.]
NALENGQPLYPSDQRYVDMLISKCLYPHIEEDKSLKKRIDSLDQKIQNVKRDYRNKTEIDIKKEIPMNFCSRCGSAVPRMYMLCPKCGTFHDEYNFGEPKKEKPKQKRHVETVTERRKFSTNYCRKCSLAIPRTSDFCPECGAYQNSSVGILKENKKQKRYAGLAAAGIILIILGAFSFIILSEYSSICGSNIGIFAQIISRNALQECTAIQIFNTLGIIMLILGIVLLIIRAVKTRN